MNYTAADVTVVPLPDFPGEIERRGAEVARAWLDSELPVASPPFDRAAIAFAVGFVAQAIPFVLVWMLS